MAVAKRLSLHIPGVWVLFILAVAVITSCGSPTNPTPAQTPTPTPTPAPTQQGATHQLSSFTATPSTIVDGADLTLAWTGDAGIVSLSIKSSPAFATGRPSTGSHVLRPGMAGYPPVGQTTYQAANSDVGARLEATVTVVAPTPTPTPDLTPTPAKLTVALAAAADTTCHPKGNVPASVGRCHVDFTATGSGYSSLVWSGCCAGSSGSIGQCMVARLQDYTCTVTATGTAGSVTASATATGVNAAPVAVYSGTAGTVACGGQFDINFSWTDADGDAPTQADGAVLAGDCTIQGPYYGVAGAFAVVMKAPATGGGGECRIQAWAYDGWITSSPVNSAWINACP